MKVDLNSVSASQVQIEREAKAPTTTDLRAVPSVLQDQATLSSGSTSVKALVSQALTTPPVRQDKIDALRQSVSSGEYKADPSKIADGIIAEDN